MANEQPFIVSPDQVLSTLTKEGTRRWLYPKLSAGYWHARRRLIGWILVTIYVIAPFVSINGKPLLLLDIIGRRFTIAGQTFFATDNIYLLLLLLSLVLIIVACSSLLGRVWCGWACPQTVYLEFVFRPIERWIEGSPAKRQKRDLGSLNFDKAWRKIVKYALYLFIAWVLANSFVAYFVGGSTILHWMTLSPFEHPTPFLVMIIVAGGIVFDFAYFREQLCTIACPYARLQSVLLDPNSVVVAYDKQRGEPRGKGRGNTANGDCIDCGMCVDTCPTGIDIRNGLQMECIHCTQCVDACDAVMEKIGRPTGLVRYSSLQELSGTPTRYLRPRTIIYGVLITLILTTLITLIYTRAAFEAQIFRAPGTTFTQLANGRITNLIRFKLTNHSEAPAKFELRLLRPASATLIAPENPVTVPVSQVATTNAFVEFSPQHDDEHEEAHVEVLGPNNFRQELEINLVVPHTEEHRENHH